MLRNRFKVKHLKGQCEGIFFHKSFNLSLFASTHFPLKTLIKLTEFLKILFDSETDDRKLIVRQFSSEWMPLGDNS
jgi:hypothetical protein